MSAEAFTTLLTVDIRTRPDGGGSEFAEALTGQPRMFNPDGTWNDKDDGWAAVAPYAEDVIFLAAQAIREQEMEGISGDHRERREDTATILESIAGLVRLMALDHAHDSELTDYQWIAGLQEVAKQLNRMQRLW